MARIEEIYADGVAPSSSALVSPVTAALIALRALASFLFVNEPAFGGMAPAMFRR